MFDELLGRAALKERIADLESEKDDLEAQLAAERERRADAVSDRQAAEERVNRLEDRVAELEDRVERAEAAGGGGPDYRGRERPSARRTETLLARLRSFDAPPEGALTTWVSEDAPVPDPVADLLGDRARLAVDAAPCLVCVDDAGLLSVALRPPLAGVDAAVQQDGGAVSGPSGAATFADGPVHRGPSFALDDAWFLPAAQGRYALAVVRSDVFALGEYEAGERVAVRGFESDVKGTHSKGGFSQGRFERRREAQIDEHLDDVREVLADAPRPLFVVGESTVVGEFADVARVTAPADATGEPEAALEAAHEDFWRSRLWLL
ncbi:MAG: Vms1/Ankzf1 family peptidyl-tRNA hydrolase [Halobacteriaceae archaeon]